MNVQKKLKMIFPFAEPTLSVYSLSDIKKILYKKSHGNVYTAAFSRDLQKNVTIPAFDYLAEELFTYFGASYAKNKESFDQWHNRISENFLRKLNSNCEKEKQYGKAQKVLNMALKYIYCCNDAPLEKFTHAHIALDGYTYIGTNRKDYPLSFCRDILFPQMYEKKPRGRKSGWSNLGKIDYLDNVRDIRNFINAYPHTFNEYLNACHSEGLFTHIIPLSKNEDRVLTPFEAEFFIWAICKNNKDKVFSTLF